MEDLFDLFDLFEVQPEGRVWRGAVNGRETASLKLAELSAKTGKPVFAMNLQTREILEFAYPDRPLAHDLMGQDNPVPHSTCLGFTHD